MKFFNTSCNKIDKEEWMNLYSSYYFNGCPYNSNLNQTSRYVENEIIRILDDKNHLFTREDLILILAWKINEIDHLNSINDIKFKNNFNITLQNSRFHKTNYKIAIDYILQHLDEYKDINKISVSNIEKIYASLKGLPGIGHVYSITLIYFFSHGEWPIYDQFADIAIYAILKDIPPGSEIIYKEQNSWAEYIKYTNNIKTIFGQYNIPRNIDQALWVYGHCFKKPSKPKHKNIKYTKTNGFPTTPRRSIHGINIIEASFVSSGKKWNRLRIKKRYLNKFIINEEYIVIFKNSKVKGRITSYGEIDNPQFESWCGNQYAKIEIDIKNIEAKEIEIINVNSRL